MLNCSEKDDLVFTPTQEAAMPWASAESARKTRSNDSTFPYSTAGQSDPSMDASAAALREGYTKRTMMEEVENDMWGLATINPKEEFIGFAERNEYYDR